MSLDIIAYPTVSGMSAALDGQEAGISLKGRFIGVGTGLQNIELDDAGRATTERLLEPVAWLEVLNARRVSEYQWQLTVDIAGTNGGVEYNLGEIALSSAETVETANDHVISIYSRANQGMMTLSPQVDHALIGINMLHATMPADSIEIIHQNLPLELSVVAEMAAIMVSVGEMGESVRQSVQSDIQLRSEIEVQGGLIEAQSLDIENHQQVMTAQAERLTVFESWQVEAQAALAKQTEFNAVLHRAFGTLSPSLTS